MTDQQPPRSDQDNGDLDLRMSPRRPAPRRRRRHARRVPAARRGMRRRLELEQRRHRRRALRVGQPGPRRHPARRLRRRRHRRDAQPADRRHADRPGPHPEPLRPAGAGQRRPDHGPGLALEWNANSDATVYEVKLRPDVTWHNGKSFGADDVIYSIQQMAKPATSYAVPFVSRHRPQGPEEDQRPDREDPAEGTGRRPGDQLHAVQHLDLPGRRDQLQEPGRHRPVHVRVVHAGPAERLQEEPELLGQRAAVRRRAEDHLDRRPDRASQRAAERRHRRDGPAADGAGQGARADRATCSCSAASRRSP